MAKKRIEIPSLIFQTLKYIQASGMFYQASNSSITVASVTVARSSLPLCL